jgi:hypothetical protein
MRQDPKGFAASDSNLYRYVYNGPTGTTDPTGNSPTLIPPVPIMPPAFPRFMVGDPFNPLFIGGSLIGLTIPLFQKYLMPPLPPPTNWFGPGQALNPVPFQRYISPPPVGNPGNSILLPNWQSQLTAPMTILEFLYWSFKNPAPINTYPGIFGDGAGDLIWPFEHLVPFLGPESGLDLFFPNEENEDPKKFVPPTSPFPPNQVPGENVRPGLMLKWPVVIF